MHGRSPLLSRSRRPARATGGAVAGQALAAAGQQGSWAGDSGRAGDVAGQPGFSADRQDFWLPALAFFFSFFLHKGRTLSAGHYLRLSGIVLIGPGDLIQTIVATVLG